MPTLDESDLARVLDVVHDVSRTLSPAAFADTALRRVHDLVDSDVSSFNEVDPDAERMVFVSEPADFVYDPSDAAALTRLAGQHPLVRHYLDTGDGSAIRISDLWSRDRWHASALYIELYSRLGVEHQMSITLPAPMPIVVAIAVNRAAADRDFDGRERARLDAVRPHLAQAWRRAREYERMAMLTRTAAAVLGEGGALVIALEDPPVELTPGALTTLYRFFGRPGARDALPPRVRAWLRAQEADVGSARLAAPLRASDDGRRLVVRHLPAQPDRTAALLLDVSSAPLPDHGLRRVGLTDREASVIVLVAQGRTTAQIATELSVSPWTVKRHLANCYAKLGVRNRAEATAAVLDVIGHHRLGY